MTERARAARQQADRLVNLLVQADASLVNLDGVDLGTALAQQLFFAIRDDRSVPEGGLSRLRGRAVALARPLAAAALGAFPATARPGDAPLVALVREPTHYLVIQQIEAELRDQGGEALALVRVGRAAAVAPVHAVAPRLSGMVRPGRALSVLAFELRLGRLRRATRSWNTELGSRRADELRRVARLELGRIALATAGLASVVDRWKPSLLAAMDEKGTWARILPAIAARMGVPSLDLPHAEASDPVASAGLAYDRIAVYGSRAAEVLARADYPAEQITPIGAPRFDPLVRAGANRSAGGGSRRVVFAAQYVSGAMRADVHAACFRGAMAAAEAVQAPELVVVPHPAEPPDTAAGLVAANPAPAGLAVRLAEPGALHREIGDAWLLVTGWSNSVFEASVAGIPAVTINPGGVAPVDFAADGLALAAADEASAAAAAASLLDPTRRAAVVARSRAAAEERLGPLDGRASERAAGLMLRMARGRGESAA